MRIISRFLAVAVLLPGLVLAKHPKIAPDLDGADPAAFVNVIVQFKHVPTDLDHQNVRSKDGSMNNSLELVKAGAYSMPAANLRALADDPDVEFIHPDRPLGSSGWTGTLDYGWMTATGIGTAKGRLAYDGTGIGVALIDSGIDVYPDLKDSSSHSRIVYSQSFVRGDNNTGDAFGHGNHVAGLVGGNGSSSSSSKYTYMVRGIAPNANLINLRALDKNGEGTDSSVIAAIQRAIALKQTYNIRIINLSLGRPVVASYLNDPLCQAVEAAWNAGIVVVVAAGNEGRNNS
ncbi:MAG TPA: S8 family serine peptidase, partial [Candidatus Acidoferrum sp.]|nr:S8 family serine peptidase [Candidatus Acidoferrum sp.]